MGSSIPDTDEWASAHLGRQCEIRALLYVVCIALLECRAFSHGVAAVASRLASVASVRRLAGYTCSCQTQSLPERPFTACGERT